MATNDLFLADWVQRSANPNPDVPHVQSAGVYLGLSLGHIVFVECLSLANTAATVRAGKRVHRECVDHLLHAPISWFESTPSGRIISRFSGDLGMVDRMLAFIFDDCFQFFFLLLALFFVVCYIIQPLIPVVLVGVIVFALQLLAVDRTNREVKRYANQSLAPVLTNIAETVGSREIIQVMNLQNYFCKRHWNAVDDYCRFNYCTASLQHWGSLVSLLIAFVLSSCAAMIVVFQRESYNPSLVGLALTYR
jgi:ABC-type multidrug transport system fused ATPase/permease subunit